MKEELVPVEIAPLEAIPVIIGQGRYRLYQKPNGSMRIQFREDSANEDAHFEFPAALMELARDAAEGKLSPAQMMKRVMKLMSGMRP